MSNANKSPREDNGMTSYEPLYPMDEVLYDGKHWIVNNAVWADTDGMQVVSLIRLADIQSNRPTRDSIKVRANECRVLREVGLEMWRKQYGDEA